MENRLPTEDEKAATAKVMRNIANLLKSGLFVGENANSVAQAIHWLDSGASFFGIPQTPPDLQVVPNESA